MPLQIHCAESHRNLPALADAVNRKPERSGRCIVVVGEGFDPGGFGVPRPSPWIPRGDLPRLKRSHASPTAAREERRSQTVDTRRKAPCTRTSSWTRRFSHGHTGRPLKRSGSELEREVSIRSAPAPGTWATVVSSAPSGEPRTLSPTSRALPGSIRSKFSKGVPADIDRASWPPSCTTERSNERCRSEDRRTRGDPSSAYEEAA